MAGVHQGDINKTGGHTRHRTAAVSVQEKMNSSYMWCDMNRNYRLAIVSIAQATASLTQID